MEKTADQFPETAGFSVGGPGHLADSIRANICTVLSELMRRRCRCRHSYAYCYCSPARQNHGEAMNRVLTKEPGGRWRIDILNFFRRLAMTRQASGYRLVGS